MLASAQNRFALRRRADHCGRWIRWRRLRHGSPARDRVAARDYGISIADAKAGAMEAENHQ